MWKGLQSLIWSQHPLKTSVPSSPHSLSVSFIVLILRILICRLVYREAPFSRPLSYLSINLQWLCPIPLPSPYLPSKPKHISALHLYPSHWCSHHLWIRSPIKENSLSQNTSHGLESQSDLLLQTTSWRCLEAQSRPIHWRVHYGRLLSKWILKNHCAILKSREFLSVRNKEVRSQTSLTFNKFWVFISRKSLKSLYCSS